jgi:hypothetical protein
VHDIKGENWALTSGFREKVSEATLPAVFAIGSGFGTLQSLCPKFALTTTWSRTCKTSRP